MMEPPEQKFEWGQRVKATMDLFNDGSFPDRPADALLVKEGELGEVVQVGLHEESNTAIYLVEFNGQQVVGCLDEEITAL